MSLNSLFPYGDDDDDDDNDGGENAMKQDEQQPVPRITSFGSAGIIVLE